MVEMVLALKCGFGTKGPNNFKPFLAEDWWTKLNICESE